MKYLYVFCLGLFFSCQSQEISPMQKIKGLSLVSEKKLMTKDEIFHIDSMNAEWCAVIPFSFMVSLSSPELGFNSKWQWEGEKIDGCSENIKLLHNNGMKVMLKPQIWIGRGEFTGKIHMNSEDDWNLFEENYTKYILSFAEVAEENNVELFCIGTEMKRSVIERPQFWMKLIQKIRAVYSGKLTYAENWDCFAEVPFWNALDYIGIDAYFPLHSGKTPSIDSLNESWKEHYLSIKSLSEKFNKKVLFTEYGYRSIDETAKSPWDFSKNGIANEQAQYNALSSLYTTFWKEDFFVGGFLWKWHPNHNQAGGEGNKMFTVQRKKAEDLVREMYK